MGIFCAYGEENLVQTRRTINRGDYKRMENEIAKALQEGKWVSVHIKIEYNGESGRPTKIRAEYIIDGKKTDAMLRLHLSRLSMTRAEILQK